MTDQINHLTKEVINDTRSDLEALIFVNLPSKYVKENTEAEHICKNMADDILEQFELIPKKQNDGK